MSFTPKELAEMAAADAEIEALFHLEPEDLTRARELDRLSYLEGLPPEKRKLAAQQRAYREANREKYNDYMRAYRKRKRGEHSERG